MDFLGLEWDDHGGHVRKHLCAQLCLDIVARAQAHDAGHWQRDTQPRVRASTVCLDEVPVIGVDLMPEQAFPRRKDNQHILLAETLLHVEAVREGDLVGGAELQAVFEDDFHDSRADLAHATSSIPHMVDAVLDHRLRAHPFGAVGALEACGRQRDLDVVLVPLRVEEHLPVEATHPLRERPTE